MNKWVTNFILGLLTTGVGGAMTYATYQVFIVSPRVEAKVEKIDVIEVKLDRLNDNMVKVMTKLEIK